MPPPVPGTGIPSTFLGFFPRRDPSTAPPIRPAAPVAIPATTAAFDPPPFWLLRELPWLPLRELPWLLLRDLL